MQYTLLWFPSQCFRFISYVFYRVTSQMKVRRIFVNTEVAVLIFYQQSTYRVVGICSNFFSSLRNLEADHDST